MTDAEHALQILKGEPCRFAIDKLLPELLLPIEQFAPAPRLPIEQLNELDETILPAGLGK
jgi:hypothetical protein